MAFERRATLEVLRAMRTFDVPIAFEDRNSTLEVLNAEMLIDTKDPCQQTS